MIHKYRVETIDVQDNIAIITAVPKRTALHFTPGQYASVGFMNGWRPSPMRCFSIIGEPTSNRIQFAVRIYGHFTKALSQLQAGDELLVRGGFGSFYIDKTDKRVVMLASGIGITPFLSMLQQPPSIPITLLYSNRSAQNIPFHDRLCSLARSNHMLRIGFFASEDMSLNSDVISGRISEAHIRKVTTGEYTNSTYFICGSNNFMDQTTKLLYDAGVSSDMIIRESFTQKTKHSSDPHASIRRMTYGASLATLAILVVGIMALDLSRSVPKLVSAQSSTTAAKTSSITTSSNSSTDSPSPSSGTSNSSPSTGSSSTTPDTTSSTSSNNNATSTQSQTNYQPPMSSVS